MRQVHKLDLQWTLLLSIVCTNIHFLLKSSLKPILDNHSSVADCFLFSFGPQETQLEAIQSFFVPHALDIDDHYNSCEPEMTGNDHCEINFAPSWKPSGPEASITAQHMDTNWTMALPVLGTSTVVLELVQMVLIHWQPAVLRRQTGAYIQTGNLRIMSLPYERAWLVIEILNWYCLSFGCKERNASDTLKTGGWWESKPVHKRVENHSSGKMFRNNSG